ncbi:hypothetical protein DB35_17950 [Streptomyces abyssalis]|uniref:Uncharacterized protein n=1 Tax=Streptomyces abyssalis TaxID=933944 RepID=A0A1E7JKS6_9ACTN|nr:hypothetical protein [Streptomyces abyssalis]OEU88254.1 hypothetical protein AN215_19110 [Streptomyces abyssalis]OEU91124.1 hypothetical protein DB35_17950 [Streptomyces abyssalis]OEV30835.1 hypothetical protein AN219_08430 [Streptomyces nanshensis]
MNTTATTAQRPAAGNAPSDLLRTSLRVDGWSTAAFGVVMLAGSGWFGGLLGLPATWSVPFGIAMLGGAAALGLIAGYPEIPSRLAALVVVGNALSCVAMLLLAFTDVVALTGLGTAFVVVGALVVAVFAEVEFIGLRRSGPGSAVLT